MKKVEKANRIKGILFALPFAVMQLIGKDLSADNKINDLTLGKFYIMRALILFTGYFVVAYVLSVLGFYIIEKLREKVAANKKNTVERIDIRSYLKSVLGVFVFWIPYYIFFFPGTSNIGDTDKQIRMFFHRPVKFPLNVSPVQGPDIYITDHHPFFTTWLYGSFVKLGITLFGRAWMGVAIFSFMQMLLFCVFLVFILFRVRSFGLPSKIFKLGIVFTALFPFYPMLAVCMVKDMTFSFFCLTTVWMIFEISMSEGRLLKNKWFVAGFAISNVLFMLSKGQGKYFVMVLAVMMMAVYWKYWYSVAITTVLPIFFVVVVWGKILLPVWNISPGGKQEAIGTLLQQSARYVVTYPDEVTEEEKNAIAAVIDYDNIAENFDPTVTNPIKITFNQKATKEQMRNYYKCWFAMFLKHPGLYFESTLNTCYKFFDMTWEGNPFFVCFNIDVEQNDELYVESFFTSGEIGNNIKWLFTEIRAIPIIGILFKTSFYTWVVWFLFLVNLKKRNSRMLVFCTIPILSIMVYAACPRSLPRYAEPVIMMIVPMLMATIVTGTEVEKSDNSDVIKV